MIYQNYSIGGELYHSAKGTEKKDHKYIDKVRTKTGKWRYIYKNTKNYGVNGIKLEEEKFKKSMQDKFDFRDSNKAIRDRLVKDLEYGGSNEITVKGEARDGYGKRDFAELAKDYNRAIESANNDRKRTEDNIKNLEESRYYSVQGLVDRIIKKLNKRR